MSKLKFVYVRIDTEKHFVETSGIRFYDFYCGIGNKPNHILVLKGYPSDSLYHKDLCMEYMSNEQIRSFIQLDSCQHGDFCWVDFAQEENLDDISNQELSELLFIAHKFEPLNGIKFNSINNRYIYCSHDDEYLTRIYMEAEKYIDVIEFVVLDHLKLKNKILFSGEIKDMLLQLCRSGIIFDFEQKSDRIKLYVVQEKIKIDDIYKRLAAFRKQRNGWYLMMKNNEWILDRL